MARERRHIEIIPLLASERPPWSIRTGLVFLFGIVAFLIVLLCFVRFDQYEEYKVLPSNHTDTVQLANKSDRERLNKITETQNEAQLFRTHSSGREKVAIISLRDPMRLTVTKWINPHPLSNGDEDYVLRVKKSEQTLFYALFSSQF